VEKCLLSMWVCFSAGAVDGRRMTHVQGMMDAASEWH
jgi:hypothetical protein